jgi:hypothetical protein
VWDGFGFGHLAGCRVGGRQNRRSLRYKQENDGGYQQTSMQSWDEIGTTVGGTECRTHRSLLCDQERASPSSWTSSGPEIAFSLKSASGSPHLQPKDHRCLRGSNKLTIPTTPTVIQQLASPGSSLLTHSTTPATRMNYQRASRWSSFKTMQASADVLSMKWTWNHQEPAVCRAERGRERSSKLLAEDFGSLGGLEMPRGLTKRATRRTLAH